MNIVYLVHQNSWEENSGTPILTQQYANLAIKSGYSVCIIVPSFDDRKKNFKKDNIFYHYVNGLKNWSDNVFKERKIKPTINFELPFKPDIIHIIDWVHFDPNFIEFLKSYKVPILRHINSFEDFCYFHHPIYKEEQNTLCKSPLTTRDCSDCIALNKYKSLKILKKIKYFIFNEKKNIFDEAEKSLKFRDQIIKKHFNEIYDCLIFGSSSFSKYFFSHIDYKKEYSIIKHGVDFKKKHIKQYNDRKINIIYTGGRSVRKGWQIVENSFYYLLKNYKKKINVRIYGDKKKLEKSSIGKFDSVEFFDFFEYKELEKTISWADIAILPTLFEPYGIIISEFLSLGVVPITTSSFGPSEIIKNNSNGLFIEKPYTINLIKKVEDFINDKSLLSIYSQNAYKTILPTKENEFENIVKLYQKFIN